jgi:crotonobetainyl-CoA:carnitine CoA-transferase CaiB-like acyl-CoA transferase
LSGPLTGIRVVEFAGLGPTPFAAMMLADFGADVLRIEKLGAPAVSPGDRAFDFLNRGRPSIALDLKAPEGLALARELIGRADVLLEGYRPGVMERLGLGPAPLAEAHPALIYARMTGWGQSGPLARKAGHDINYVAMTGGLYIIGDADRPPPPPANVFGDFGGGSMFVVTGIMAALLERTRSGLGQIVDAGRAICLTAPPISIAATRRRTVAISQSARSSRSSTRRYCAAWDSIPTRSPIIWSRRAGRTARPCSPRSSGPARATTGSRRSPPTTPASARS